jgi:hypothetical protein
MERSCRPAGDLLVKVEYIEETTVRKALAFEIEPEVVDKEIADRAKDYARRPRSPASVPARSPRKSSGSGSCTRSWRTRPRPS